MAEDTRTFGSRVRVLREGYGWTLSEFADKSGLSAAYLSKIERGEVPPPKGDKIEAIADALRQAVDSLGALAEQDRSTREVTGLMRELATHRAAHEGIAESFAKRLEEVPLVTRTALPVRDQRDSVLDRIGEELREGIRHGRFEISVSGTVRADGVRIVTVK